MPDDARRFGHAYEYTALRPLDVGGVRAYNVGDGVPTANVKEQGYVEGEDVAKAGSAKEKKLLAVDDPETPPSTPVTAGTGRG
jgi:hypothetical protein